MKESLLGMLLFLACTTNNTIKHKPVGQPVSIPFSFGFNNDYLPADSTLIEVFDPNDSLVFKNTGYKPYMGFKPGGKFIVTGKYKVEVAYYSDSVTKKRFQEFFEINGKEDQIDLAINLIRSYTINEIHVTKYFGNDYNVQLKRIWDPQKQYSTRKELLPEYEWRNSVDSTIYGIYRRFSSSSMISWVQNWDIGFMSFQQYTDSGWVYLPCNAPRIQAGIMKDSTGKTLKDMDLSCAKKEFTKNQRYRILLEYGINDAVYRKTKASGGLDSCFYYEPHVYQLTDEFILQ